MLGEFGWLGVGRGALAVAYTRYQVWPEFLSFTHLENEPLQDGVYLRDLWPSSAEIQATIAQAIHGDLFTKSYADVFTGDETWRTLPVPEVSVPPKIVDSTPFIVIKILL